MLFVVSGHLRAGVETERVALNQEFTYHLGQRSPRVRLGGPLRNEQGEQIGVFYIAEAESQGAVETLVHESPYSRAGLYDRIDITRMDLEVGSLG